jgi:hypothetical protein
MVHRLLGLCLRLIHPLERSQVMENRRWVRGICTFEGRADGALVGIEVALVAHT